MRPLGVAYDITPYSWKLSIRKGILSLVLATLAFSTWYDTNPDLTLSYPHRKLRKRAAKASAQRPKSLGR